MADVEKLVSATVQDSVCILRIDNPPVNVLTHDVRTQLSKAVVSAAADPAVQAIVIAGTDKFFISGAEIKEFAAGLSHPTPAELADQIEGVEKPVIAALIGPVLGIGVELAMACHYRVADSRSQLGMPEITLGVVPGAGGTQRLPRLIGVASALELLLSGKPVPAGKALELKLIDEIAAGDLTEVALAAAKRFVGKPLRRTGLLASDTPEPGVFEAALAQAAIRMRGHTTPDLIAAAVRASRLPLGEGLAIERELVYRSFEQPESRALRHLFFAERETHRVQGLSSNTRPRTVARVAVIGSGTMGGGIAMTCADAGLQVQMLDVKQTALHKGLERIASNYEISVKRGSLSTEEAAARRARIQGVNTYDELGEADLFIEAVPEILPLKKEVFAQLNTIARPGAILATNTSTLDINQIASVTSRCADVVGLHFFSPANVMRLLEIVRTDTTADDVIATAFALAKKIKKIGVLSRVCYGFIGNRMMDPYAREAERAVLEGATPTQVDGALEAFGMAMGILAVFDMAGVDVAALTRRESNDPTYYRCSSVLYQNGFLGQKTGTGFYRYEGRKRLPNPQAEELFRKEASRLGVPQHPPGQKEIQERCFTAMVNEAALILQEGVAQRASDIDVVYTAGYGFPRFRGGPMCWADSIGLQNVVNSMYGFADRFGTQNWTPAPLLVELANSNRRFADWNNAG